MQLTVLTLAESSCLPDLSEPLIDHAEGQLFLNEAFKIIVEEVLCNGTDVSHKVQKKNFFKCDRDSLSYVLSTEQCP